MRRPYILPLAAAIVLTPALIALVPQAIDMTRLLVAQDDPVALADRAVAESLSAQRAREEIEEALAAGDVELAQSFIALAQEKGIPVDPVLVTRIADANSASANAVRAGAHFVRGLVTGEPNDLAEFAGTATGDLFVFGDIRDAAREGGRMIAGEKADELILGLACAGLAITAGTYVTAGAAAPARVGLSLVKAARKTGALGARLTSWTTRSLREAVDTAAVGSAVSRASLLQPAVAVRAVRDGVKFQKMEKLIAAAGDLARLQRAGGTRAALDGMKVAEGPRDLSRLARLAESKGIKTRAILKLGGRAAIALMIGAYQVASLLLWAVSALLGFCAFVKRAAERATENYLRHCKRRRALLLASAASVPLPEVASLGSSL